MRQTEVTCERCAASVPALARFCPACGTPTAADGVPALEARKLVTVVFCDLTGSTELSGRLDAESLRTATLRYFALMRDRLERHGGTVEKFIGDAVMAVFGVPVLHEDDAQRAVRAGLDMLTALDGLNEELQRTHGVRLRVRIGINTGEVVATGDPFAQQVLVSGEVVNVAARLEQNARPGEILIGPQTFRSVERLVVTEVVGPLQLKGKTDTVLARRLIDLRGDDPAVLRRFDSAFVGRHSELREMQLTADRAVQQRQCQLLTLFGEAGIGKTRLARQWLAQTAASGMLVGTGRCRPYGEGGSLLPLADALRPIIAEAAAGPPDSDSDLSDALAVLQAGLLLDGAPSPSLEDTCWAVTCLLEAVGTRRPLVLTIDDCQWASDPLFEVLDHIVADLHDTPAVLLCTARPDLLDRRPGWGSGVLNAGALVVPPLLPEEARLLAGSLDEVAAHSADHSGVLDRAEGNPLYLEQLLAMLAEAPDGPGVRDPAELPPTMHALIAARIEALNPGQRAALDVAAIAGRDFTLDEVGATLPPEPDRDPLEPLVHSLVRRRLVEPSRSSRRGRGTPYRFASALIREVAYGGMAKRTRAERHERLADHLLQRGSDDESVGAHLERAFRHRSELGPLDEAAERLRSRTARHLGAAGVTAMERCDLVRAADLLERTVTLHGTDSAAGLPVAQRLGEVLFALGRAEQGRQLLDEVRATALRTGAVRIAAHAELYLACMDPTAGFAASVTTARATAPVFEAAGDALGLARVELRLGQFEQLSGHFAVSRDLLERALAHAASVAAGPECATALGALAVSLWLGPTEAGTAIGLCRGLLAEHAERRAVRATVSYPLAVLHALRGEEPQARACLALADPIMRELGIGHAAAFTPLFTAAVDALAGRPEAAAKNLREAHTAATGLGDSALASTAALSLSRVLLTLRHFDSAASELDRLDATPAGSPVDDAERDGVRARVLAATGRAEAALPPADRAVASAQLADCTAGLATAHLDRAHVLRALGRPHEARAAATEARAGFLRKDHRVGRSWADTFLSDSE
ncbi:adenylate/guanylate cyclase domain-containing protein [Streptacidiphilus sp. PAMC 29251]